MSLNTQKIKAALQRDMLGLCDALGIVPNKSLSKRQELRSGSNGSLSVVLSGRKAGSWFDHELGRGGSPIDLIQRELGLRDWRAAADWARDYLGDVELSLGPVKTPDSKPPVDIDFKSMKNANRAQQIWDQAVSAGAILPH